MRRRLINTEIKQPHYQTDGLSEQHRDYQEIIAHFKKEIVDCEIYQTTDTDLGIALCLRDQAFILTSDIATRRANRLSTECFAVPALPGTFQGLIESWYESKDCRFLYTLSKASAHTVNGLPAQFKGGREQVNGFNSYPRDIHISLGIGLLKLMKTPDEMIEAWAEHDLAICCFSHLNPLSETEKKWNLVEREMGRNVVHMKVIDGEDLSKTKRIIGFDHIMYVCVDWYMLTGRFYLPGFSIENDAISMSKTELAEFNLRYDLLSELYMCSPGARVADYLAWLKRRGEEYLLLTASEADMLRFFPELKELITKDAKLTGDSRDREFFLSGEPKDQGESISFSSWNELKERMEGASHDNR